MISKEEQKLILQALDRLNGSIQTIRAILTPATKNTGTTTPTEAPATTPSQENGKQSTTPSKTATSNHAATSKKSQKSRYPTALSLSADELGPTPEISDAWPIAIAKHAIIRKDDSDEHKQYRAIGIKGIIENSQGFDFKDKTILDYGCGEGHTSIEFGSQAAKVIGYDIKKSPLAPTESNIVLTDSPQIVEQNGPYDYIICFDVLDHIEREEPAEVLTRLANLLSTSGKIFCRCHPWTSKHGGHLYEDLNKAWVHLALTADELVTLGYSSNEHTIKLSKPMATYAKWFNIAGLNIENRKIQQDKVPDYFDSDLIDRIARVTWAGKLDSEQIRKIMANSFVDYVLIR